MSDPNPTRPDREDKRTFLQKIAEFIHPGPDSTDELIETLAEAEHNQLIGSDSRKMLEGVIRMAALSVRRRRSLSAARIFRPRPISA